MPHRNLLSDFAVFLHIFAPCLYCPSNLLQVSPGDVVAVSGIFLPIPFTGFRAIRAGLTADTFLDAMAVDHYKKRFSE